MLDASVLNKLAEVVEKVTDKSRLDIDPVSLQQLKLLCKASDDNVVEVFDLLLDRLKASDAQVCSSTCIVVQLSVSCWCSDVAHTSMCSSQIYMPFKALVHLLHPWFSTTQFAGCSMFGLPVSPSDETIVLLVTQTRLHALEVCDMLFGRSRTFRTAAAAQFPALLVGSTRWSLELLKIS